MDYLPIFMDIKGRECLIIGGGEVASRKVEMLLRAHANVTVIAPTVGDNMQKMLDNNDIKYQACKFDKSLIKNPVLIYAATNDRNINKKVYEVAQAQNIPINVVDTPDLCSFITPSIIDRSPVVAAVSTAGASPILARQIRTKLEALIPSSYGKLAKFAKSYRKKVKKSIVASKRGKFWESIFQGIIPELIFSGQIEKAQQELDKILDSPDVITRNNGEVYLIGGGPGDPDLLTFRALRLMQQADVVVYDRLISNAVLDLTRKDAKRIYVGKKQSTHVVPQSEINHLLINLAKDGNKVVRLKGGDPFIFGRGGEEIEELSKAGILFQVVPGITAALGAASYAGIPLTHRDYAQSVIFATGRLKNDTTGLNWQALAQPNQTIVFYMGLQKLNVICTKLIAHNMHKDTPIALIQNATTDKQKEIIGTLGTLPTLVQDYELQPPTLMIIGNVVDLHKKLKWFKTKHYKGHDLRVF